jgi:hypothetical protein
MEQRGRLIFKTISFRITFTNNIVVLYSGCNSFQAKKIASKI